MLRSWLEGGNQNSVLLPLPKLSVLDDVMYKAIALGFAFGDYLGLTQGQRKPEVVLVRGSKRNLGLNCMAELCRVVTHVHDQRLQGNPMAWWEIIGSFITLFAFFGCKHILTVAYINMANCDIQPTEVFI